MQHIYTEEELILFYYKELETTVAQDLKNALESDPLLAKQYLELCRMLNSLSLAEKNPSELVVKKLLNNLEEHEPSL